MKRDDKFRGCDTVGTYKFRLKPGECKVIAGSRFCNRWKKRTAEASEEYKKGIENPKRPWAKTTCEAKDCYKAGVDKAHARGAYAKGVKKKGQAGYLTKTLLKGPGRFASGVAGAGDSYAKGFAPYHKGFPGIQMPKRFPRGDPRNIQRCSAVTSVFGRIKIGIAGAGDETCPSK